MKEIIEFEHESHKIAVTHANGSDDGYYWDKEYFVVIDGKLYIFLVVGSGSGWISEQNSLKQTNFDFLKDRLRQNNDIPYNDIKISDFADDKELFIRLYDFMLANNAREVAEGDEWDSAHSNYLLKVIE